MTVGLPPSGCSHPYGLSHRWTALRNVADAPWSEAALAQFSEVQWTVLADAEQGSLV